MMHRVFLMLAASGLLASTLPSVNAQPAPPGATAEAKIAAAEPKVLPLSIAIARAPDGAPVTTPCRVLDRVSEAQRLMAPHQVRVGIAELREVEGHHALETAKDRDALADLMKPGVINVFVVSSLRDVDDPSRFRMGVRWRKLSDLRKDYVIVTASAAPTTLAHELGHALGNGHSSVVDNVMSYKREDPAKIHFDAGQGAKMRAVARQLLLGKKVVALEDDGVERDLAAACAAKP
jgi:hypothetical protein